MIGWGQRDFRPFLYPKVKIIQILREGGLIQIWKWRQIYIIFSLLSLYIHIYIQHPGNSNPTLCSDPWLEKTPIFILRDYPILKVWFLTLSLPYFQIYLFLFIYHFSSWVSYSFYIFMVITGKLLSWNKIWCILCQNGQKGGADIYDLETMKFFFLIIFSPLCHLCFPLKVKIP